MLSGPYLLQILIQVVLSVYLTVQLLRAEPASRLDWGLEVGVCGLLLLFVFWIARWDWSSYYLRVAILPAGFLAAIVAYRRIGSGEPPSATSIGVRAVLVLLLLTGNGRVLVGGSALGWAVEQPVRLAYPLRGDAYYVGGGGATRWLNAHRGSPAQDHALDLLQLNAWGNRAAGLWPEEPERYAVYGDSVFTPCRGRVLVSLDAYPDQRPPLRDAVHPAGNHLVIACRGVEVLLAHLQRGSVRVRAGTSVSRGQFVARVGNSGRSSQPHLHVHAERGGEFARILDGEGVPILFDGRYLVRNDLFGGR